MATTSYTILPLASLKALLHCLKYPHSTTVGLLVGSASAHSVTVSDVIPLVHHWTQLSPALEAGLAMADLYARSKDLSVLGTYIAHCRVDDLSLDVVTRKLNEPLKSEHSLALVIDHRKLCSAGQNPFVPYVPATGEDWVRLDESQFTAQIPTNWYSSPLSVADFDDHLEDIGVDWLVNPAVVVPT